MPEKRLARVPTRRGRSMPRPKPGSGIPGQAPTRFLDTSLPSDPKPLHEQVFRPDVQLDPSRVRRQPQEIRGTTQRSSAHKMRAMAPTAQFRGTGSPPSKSAPAQRSAPKPVIQQPLRSGPLVTPKPRKKRSRASGGGTRML